ncbi:hypothetical protein [Nocardia sp. NPDC052316]|uniref:hypothetical protein n=1 Tax=Nocardia sp. NPDC052316 TaxID=3364329 RepID=UPI0037C5FC26
MSGGSGAWVRTPKGPVPELARPIFTVGLIVGEQHVPAVFDTLGCLRGIDRLEVVIMVDSLPNQSVRSTAQQRVGSCVNLRWLPWEPGTAALNTLFAHAAAEWVLCVRPGVRLEATALEHLTQFVAEHPDCGDLLQGPRSDDSRHQDSTHMDPVWHHGRFGVPVYDDRAGAASHDAIEIGMQDLGFFACRKDRWPGVHARLGMQTGPVGYLHKKFRAQTGRTLCLSSLRWTDTLHEPAEQQWTPEQLFTYLLCWEDTGTAVEPILEHYAEGQDDAWVEHYLAHWQASRNNPFAAFGTAVCINADDQPDRWARMTARFRALGIAETVERLPAIRTPDRYQLGCALSHRSAVAMARARGLESILVFEDDAVFLNGATWVLRHSVAELRQTPWRLFYLGGFYLNKPNALRTDCPVAGATFLRHAPGLVTTHAIAYHERIYDQILNELPSTPEEMYEFLADYDGHVDVYYAERFNEGIYRCTPTVASQENYIRAEQPHLRDQFLLDP